MRVANTSSNLKGTYVKVLRDAAAYIAIAWKDRGMKETGPAPNGGTATMRTVEERLLALEEENAALRQELARRPAPDPTSRESKSESARIETLEKELKELGPRIREAIEERNGGGRPRTPEPRRKADHSATPKTIQKSAPPKEQGNDEWKVVESRKKRKEKKTPASAGDETKKGATSATQVRNTGAPKQSTNTTTATRKEAAKTQRTTKLPRTPRTSAVTITIREGANMSYADVLATAREKIPLKEIGVEAVEMRKAMTGAIVIRVPGDKDRGKASRLAAKLNEVLDPTVVKIAAPIKTAELRLAGIDISMRKEELRRALASAAGCGNAEVQVGEIGTTRSGFGTAWVKCPVAGARKLTHC
ncbi:uncharacterized protein LOC132915940 [Bombus pascuorum]|uniref:uncharacterized protein LOC132915940 n=1 Tax=Bombus pascuorum TaxID=65598 RepID=UPI00298DCA22|nr:uncharacterized protein LOC132915940 [Bombus pascuorum]